MNKILVVNVNWLGDAVFSTPVFKALRRAYPQARIACLCVPRVRDVLSHCPHLDDIIVYDEKGRDRGLFEKTQLILRLRAYGFDAAFLLHRSMTRALLVYLAGIPIRIGFGKSSRLLTTMVDEGRTIHRGDRYLRVIEAGGITCLDRSCELRVDPKDGLAMDEKLKTCGLSKDGFIILNTGGNWDLKRWSLSMWAMLAGRIKSQTKLDIVFTGSVKDRADAEYVMMSSGIEAFNFAGQTSLGETLVLFQRARVVVSADSGPLHLADSVGSRTIGIFGPTRPETTGPRGQGSAVILQKDVGCNKAPCYHLKCSNNVCMQEVGVDDVWQAAQRFAG